MQCQYVETKAYKEIIEITTYYLGGIAKMKPTWVEVLLLPFDNIDRRNKETDSKGLLV